MITDVDIGIRCDIKDIDKIIEEITKISGVEHVWFKNAYPPGF